MYKYAYICYDCLSMGIRLGIWTIHRSYFYSGCCARRQSQTVTEPTATQLCPGNLMMTGHWQRHTEKPGCPASRVLVPVTVLLNLQKNVKQSPLPPFPRNTSCASGNYCLPHGICSYTLCSYQHKGGVTSTFNHAKCRALTRRMMRRNIIHSHIKAHHYRKWKYP